MAAHPWNENIQLYPTDRFFKAYIGPLFPQGIRPNHLTVLRLLLITPVLYSLSTGRYGLGILLFFVAALTDWFDGALARTRKQITEWGIVADPLVDKLLIGLVLFVVVLQHINFALGVALLGAEAFMMIAAWIRRSKGKIEPANIWGKIKMTAEVTGILLLLSALWLHIDLFVPLSVGTLALALVFAIISIFSRIV